MPVLDVVSLLQSGLSTGNVSNDEMSRTYSFRSFLAESSHLILAHSALCLPCKEGCWLCLRLRLAVSPDALCSHQTGMPAVNYPAHALDPCASWWQSFFNVLLNSWLSLSSLHYMHTRVVSIRGIVGGTKPPKCFGSLTASRIGFVSNWKDKNLGLCKDLKLQFSSTNSIDKKI